ncbi:chemotaxis protein CheW [Halorussus lipolyticus]|uniref:chemotaxis protein CheW n=1 Tax=Halorussus lipolyticus TaxID=3034024 RepID=UPI0023E8F77C|nr:chemotaxis protein CheW [Halorussus sp. DT80]
MSGDLSNAGTIQAPGDRREWVEFVNFNLGNESYALELGRVEQILADPDVTEVPQTGRTIAGVTNLGSEIPVVVEGRALLELPERPVAAEPTLLLLDRDDARPTGLLVDEVVGIEAHNVETVAPPGAVEDWSLPVGPRWFRAVVEDPDRAGQPIGVFDLDAIVREARGQS